MSQIVQPVLTPRQQQILQLLQAGKVNKEVARELDIGLGTVKQHIVAIFKKLKVKNRTAAVSRHLDLVTPNQVSATQIKTDVVLSRRPCVVLSLALAKSAQPSLMSAFYGQLAAAAAAHDAIFLTRQGNASEMIFGIQGVTEYDVAVAIQTANQVTQSLMQMQPGCEQQMRGCLSAGLALASMHRFGGWTGEVIASAAIASARKLLESTPEGMFTCDQATLDLCSAFGVVGFADMQAGVRFARLASMKWYGVRRSYPLVGRKTELDRLRKALAQSLTVKTLVLIEGEMGMGKTRLCQELLQICQQEQVNVRHFCGLPNMMGAGVCDVGQGAVGDVDTVVAALDGRSPGAAQLVLLDDFQLLGHEQQLELMRLASSPSANSQLVVFVGRKGLSQLAKADTPCIFLRRLATREVQRLVRDALVMPRGAERTKMASNILNTALGVPLFAVEMAQYPNETDISLALRVAIFSRIDKLHLDSALLTFMARQPSEVALADIVAGLNDDANTVQRQVERAVASGVLVRSSTGGLSFTHPMIRRAIDDVSLEQQASA